MILQYKTCSQLSTSYLALLDTGIYYFVPENGKNIVQAFVTEIQWNTDVLDEKHHHCTIITFQKPYGDRGKATYADLTSWKYTVINLHMMWQGSCLNITNMFSWTGTVFSGESCVKTSLLRKTLLNWKY